MNNIQESINAELFRGMNVLKKAYDGLQKKQNELVRLAFKMNEELLRLKMKEELREKAQEEKRKEEGGK